MENFEHRTWFIYTLDPGSAVYRFEIKSHSYVESISKWTAHKIDERIYIMRHFLNSLYNNFASTIEVIAKNIPHSVIITKKKLSEPHWILGKT